MSGIFISYRRDDSQDITGRLYDRLAAKFGPEAVFMDVDSIPVGADFRQILRDAVAKADIALVVIGRQWLGMTDAHGQRRLETPNDFVRIEVEEALSRGIPVVPILTQGAAAPHERELPPSISALAYRHGVEVRSDQHFDHDVAQLVAQLAPLLAAAPTPVPPRLAALGFVGHANDGVEWIVPPVCAVPAGPFLMGSNVGNNAARDPEAFDNETPLGYVAVEAFEIGKYPVTVAEYALAVRAHAVDTPRSSGGVNWRKQLERLDHPVVCIDWEDAGEYVTWLRAVTSDPGWRLPSEAQWEKAARWDPAREASEASEVSEVSGRSAAWRPIAAVWNPREAGPRYPWGEGFDPARCVTSESGAHSTMPVDAHPASDPRRSGASPCGAEEMAGNVWEWTSSLYRPYPYDASDGRETQKTGGYRTLRGGSWSDVSRSARAAHRIYDYTGHHDNNCGFRLARVPLAQRDKGAGPR